MSAFEALWDAPVAYIDTDAEEAALIQEAQAGSEPAKLRLLASYMPRLRSAVARYTRTLSLDDARSAALMGFLEALAGHDVGVSPRLASNLQYRLADAFNKEVAQVNAGVTVPYRTLQRWYGVVAEAGGDYAEAARIAPRFAMTEETFWAVFSALFQGASLNAVIESHGDASQVSVGALAALRDVSDAEDRVLVDHAFKAIGAEETVVVSYAYGFADYGTPQPDAEIGFRTGHSRLWAHRTRHRALGKMREALGVEV